jgi:hypothetical protein
MNQTSCANAPARVMGTFAAEQAGFDQRGIKRTCRGPGRRCPTGTAGRPRRVDAARAERDGRPAELLTYRGDCGLAPRPCVRRIMPRARVARVPHHLKAVDPGQHQAERDRVPLHTSILRRRTADTGATPHGSPNVQW